MHEHNIVVVVSFCYLVYAVVQHFSFEIGGPTTEALHKPPPHKLVTLLENRTTLCPKMTHFGVFTIF